MAKRRDGASREVDRPDVDAFLAEIAEVCKRHGFSIGHEDGHGSFLVHRYDEHQVESLKGASLDLDAF